MSEKALVLFSGGMDSTALLYHAADLYGAYNVSALSFKYGSKHNDAESSAAFKIAKHIGIERQVIVLDGLTPHLQSNLLLHGGDIPEGHYSSANMSKTVVPFRNGIMLSIAAGIAQSRGCRHLLIANHSGDHAIYPDCRGEFIKDMAAAIFAGTDGAVELQAPFTDIRKEDIITRVPKAPWHLTYSCYKGGTVHCGRCGTCFERREAFQIAGVDDPTEYLDNTPLDQIKKETE